MPAKTARDIPGDMVVVVKPIRFLPEMRAAAAPLNVTQELRISLGYDDGAPQLGGIEILKLDDERVTWMVWNVAAERGWGPFLYDVAMESATLGGGGLMPNRKGVSRSATAVWKHYLNCRDDVVSLPLDGILAGGQLEPALNRRYSKAPDSLLRQLDSMGLLRCWGFESE